jgi:pyruvate dehydrogenase E1 component alpha subunit
MAEGTAGANIAARAAAYAMPSAVVDGNDLWAVRAAAGEAVARARAGEGPTLLECHTYRHYGHSKSDPAPYRTDEELQRWRDRDPLTVARDRLAREGLTEDEIAAVEQAITAELDQAVENALAAPYPDPATDAAREYSP